MYKIDGRIHGKGNYKLGKKYGFWIEWNDITSSIEQGNYVDDMREGYWEIYYNYYEKIHKKINLKRGILHGSAKLYHINGKLLYDLNLKNGCIHDIGKFFHANGKLASKGFYKEMKKQKNCIKEIYPEGHLTSEKGQKDGLWEYFNKDGALIRTETWKEGKIIGETNH